MFKYAQRKADGAAQAAPPAPRAGGTVQRRALGG